MRLSLDSDGPNRIDFEFVPFQKVECTDCRFGGNREIVVKVNAGLVRHRTTTCQIISGFDFKSDIAVASRFMVLFGRKVDAFENKFDLVACDARQAWM